MKKFLLIAAAFVLTVFIGKSVYDMVLNTRYEPQTGDVIFHASSSFQSAAIKLGTLSRYSHCGIVVVKNGNPYVLEAEKGVELTPMNKWIKRGKLCHHYRVMRLKDPKQLKLNYSLGGRYDMAFRLNNGKYYCSELVWEVYKKNGVLLCDTKALNEYHFLYLPFLQKHIKSRGFGMDQQVVAPADLVRSSKLRTVSYGYFKPVWL